MSDVAHASLTGSSLHDCKGIDAASANTVRVADGAGGGSWTSLPLEALSPEANPFGSALLHVREEQANTVNGGSSITASTWSTLTLNTTKTNEITGSSLAGNQVTLPAGDYYVEASGINGITLGGTVFLKYRVRFYDVTHATELVLGPNEGMSSFIGTSHNNVARLAGRFTLASPSATALQFYNTWGSTNGGWATGAGSTEVYAEVRIWKIG